MPRHPVSISFSEDELKELDRLAKAFRQTRSALLKAAFSEYMRRLKFKRLREAGQAVARAKGFITDDDIFRTVS